MGARGPQAVDKGHLTERAREWAWLLFALRDGQPGMLTKVTWNPWERRAAWERQGQVWKRIKHRLRTSRIHHAEIVSLDRRTVEELATKFKGDENWVLSRPVFPQPGVWESLKRARSQRAVRKVAVQMRAWARKLMPGAARWRWSDPLIPVVNKRAEELVRAKRLPSYPRSSRPRSDDKRVEWFAKVLAGLESDIAPATAVKSLGRIRFPKDEVRKIKEEYVERIQAEALKEGEQ